MKNQAVLPQGGWAGRQCAGTQGQEGWWGQMNYFRIYECVFIPNSGQWKYKNEQVDIPLVV